MRKPKHFHIIISCRDYHVSSPVERPDLSLNVSWKILFKAIGTCIKCILKLFQATTQSLKVSHFWLEAHNKSSPAADCTSEIFTQRYCRCSIDKEIKLISVTLMWQQIIHGSIRSHFHSTTQRRRIPWSVDVNGSLYQPSWKARLITHSNTTVPRVVDFPDGCRFTDQRGTARHLTCFFCCFFLFMRGATDVVMLQVCEILFLSGNSLKLDIIFFQKLKTRNFKA